MEQLSNNLYNKLAQKFHSHKINFTAALYSFRLPTGDCAQDLNDSVLFMNDHFTKVTPQETLFQPDDSWITNVKDAKPYTLKHLHNTKLFTS